MKTLLLNVPALHLGFLGCYGNDEVATPNLDRLAAEGIVFDRHIAHYPKLPDGPSSSPSWISYDFPLPDSPPAESPLVSDLWRQQGGRGRFLDLRLRTGRGDSVGRIITEMKKLAEQQPSLLWVDWPTLAPPWHVPDSLLDECFAEEEETDDVAITPWLDPQVGPMAADDTTHLRLRRTYAAAVMAFDDQIGQLVERLSDNGWLDEMLLGVTAGCGLALGEHGYLGEHRAWLHEEVVHVPLVVRLAGAREAGLRVSALTQPLDLFPTLADVFGLPPFPGPGHSLLPLIRGEVEQVRSFACSGLRIASSIEWALRTPEWALLLPISAPAGDPPRQPQLYVKPDDRWEVNDVRQHNLDLAEELEKTLHDFAQRASI